LISKYQRPEVLHEIVIFELRLAREFDDENVIDFNGARAQASVAAV